jgi:hypothetical protein
VVAPLLGSPPIAERLHQCLVNLLSERHQVQRARRLGPHRGGRAIRSRSPSPCATTASAWTPQQREHLFEPFNRLGRQHDRSARRGLGLVITRRLVEAMHGELKVEQHRPGSGSLLPRSLLARVPPMTDKHPAGRRRSGRDPDAQAASSATSATCASRTSGADALRLGARARTRRDAARRGDARHERFEVCEALKADPALATCR